VIRESSSVVNKQVFIFAWHRSEHSERKVAYYCFAQDMEKRLKFSSIFVCLFLCVWFFVCCRQNLSTMFNVRIKIARKEKKFSQYLNLRRLKIERTQF